MKSSCDVCGEDFQAQDKQYNLEQLSTKVGETPRITACYLCAIVTIKEMLQTLGDNMWYRPVYELYKLLFPDEISSWFLQPLMKALTELYLHDWADKPKAGQPRLFW